MYKFVADPPSRDYVLIKTGPYFLPPSLPASSARSRSSFDLASSPLKLLKSLMTSFVFPKYTDDSEFRILILYRGQPPPIHIPGEKSALLYDSLHVFDHFANVWNMARRVGQWIIDLGLDRV